MILALSASASAGHRLRLDARHGGLTLRRDCDRPADVCGSRIVTDNGGVRPATSREERSRLIRCCAQIRVVELFDC